MPTGYFLNEKSRRDILRDREDIRKPPKKNPYITRELPRASPEVYIIRVPEGGIKGIEERGSTGTGTGDYDKVYAAECEIHNVILDEIDGTGDNEVYGLLQPDIIKRWVWGISESDIPSGWNVAIKDKFGEFMCLPILSAFVAFELEQSVNSGTTGTGTGDGIMATFLEWDFKTVKSEDELVLDNGGIFAGGTSGSKGIAMLVKGQWHIVQLGCT